MWRTRLECQMIKYLKIVLKMNVLEDHLQVSAHVMYFIMGVSLGVLIPDPAYCFVRFPYPTCTLYLSNSHFFVISCVPLDFISRFHGTIIWLSLVTLTKNRQFRIPLKTPMGPTIMPLPLHYQTFTQCLNTIKHRSILNFNGITLTVLELCPFIAIYASGGIIQCPWCLI